MQRLKNRGRQVAVASVLAVVTALGATAWQSNTTAQDRDPGASQQRSSQRSSQRDRQSASNGAKRQAHSLSEAFRHAAEVAVPTVVSIRTTTKPREFRGGDRRGNRRSQRVNPFEGTPFEDFFNDDDLFFGPNVPDGRRFTPRQQGMGSGVVVDPSGIVLTNNHVVQGADEVIVQLADGREFKASDIKTDPETDLAVLRIKAPESLPAARLGDSSQLQVGDWVIAIGTPFNLSSTVSAGIISNAGRELLSNQRTRFLQTDAAINPGNSGGPLVNLDGEVVGINTAIASSSGSFQGIGFAIPSSVARWVMSQLIETGSVQRGYLGVNIQETNTALAEQLGVGRRAGVLVAEVLPGTPAAEAGFEAGDVITEYAGKRVSTPRDLQELVERTEINSRERVTVVRDGRERQLQVMVKPLPSRGPRAAGLADEEPQERPADDEGYADNDLGLEVAELTDETAQQLGFEGREGVLVSGVESDSPADLVGLSEGMLILKVGRQTVTSVDEFTKAIRKESLDQGVLLHVRTQAGNRFVVLERE